MSVITKTKNIPNILKNNSNLNDGVVLLSIKQYNKLMEKLRDLKDVKDHIEAMKDYKAGKGKDLRKFLKEHKDEFKI